MGTRYVPFGYEITYGALAVIPQEERLVKSAFELYISGKSFKSIADRFTMTGIEYREGKPDWNKNMIKRMIENERYCGKDDYPQIIPAELFKQANELKSKKQLDIDEEKASLDKFIRQNTVCSKCGSRIHRNKHGRYANAYVIIDCANDQCGASSIRKSVLHEIILSRINELIDNPKLAEPESNSQVIDRAGIEQKSNELYCKLNDEDVDRGELLKQIFELAKYKFDRCTETDTSAIIEEIQKVLCGYSRVDKLTAELLNQMISKIHIYDGGRVQIELRNGKLI